MILRNLIAKLVAFGKQAWIRKVSLSFLAFIISLLFLEGFLRIATNSNEVARSEFYNSIGRWPEENADRFELPAFWHHTPHPYFGYVANPRLYDVNSYGFHSELEYPYQRRGEQEIVVGLLGGSVAVWGAKFLQKAFNESVELKELRECGHSFTVLNLGVGGGRQPMQFRIFLHAVDWLDIAINLEGVHETMDLAPHNLPIEFPSLTNQFFFLDASRFNNIQKIVFISKVQSWFIRQNRASKWFTHSSVYYNFARMAWKVFESLKGRERKNLNVDRYNMVTDRNERENYPEAILDLWEKSTHRQSLIAKDAGKLQFVFLQPSVLLRDSKPMTEFERDVTNAHGGDRDRFEDWYRALLQRAAQARVQNPNIFDLTNIFEGISDPIFIDSCCHMNERGREILAKAIISKVAPAIKLKWACLE